MKTSNEVVCKSGHLDSDFRQTENIKLLQTRLGDGDLSVGDSLSLGRGLIRNAAFLHGVGGRGAEGETGGAEVSILSCKLTLSPAKTSALFTGIGTR